MPMFKRKSDEEVAEQVEQENVQHQAAQEEVQESSENLNVFVPKTEACNNILLNKLNEAIKLMKQELLNSEPYHADLELYVKALKEDIVQTTILKNNFRKEY